MTLDMYTLYSLVSYSVLIFLTCHKSHGVNQMQNSVFEKKATRQAAMEKIKNKTYFLGQKQMDFQWQVPLHIREVALR